MCLFANSRQLRVSLYLFSPFSYSLIPLPIIIEVVEHKSLSFIDELFLEKILRKSWASIWGWDKPMSKLSVQFKRNAPIIIWIVRLSSNQVVLSSLNLVPTEIFMGKYFYRLGSIYTRKGSISNEIISTSSERDRYEKKYALD